MRDDNIIRSNGFAIRWSKIVTENIPAKIYPHIANPPQPN